MLPGAGGWLYQEADSLAPEEIDFTAVSETKPTEQQLEDLRFAWRIVKHVKSNAITVAKEGRLLGMGSGQPNRVKSTEIALGKAGEDVKVRARDSYSWQLPPSRCLEYRMWIASIAPRLGSKRLTNMSKSV